MTTATVIHEETGVLVLEPLPYAENALQPMISAHTIRLHHGKHQKGYVDTLNKLIADTDLAGLSLEAIIKRTAGKSDQVAVFNNAAQAWNHAFYWRSLAPHGGGEPPAALGKAIDAAFGSLAECKKQLGTAAVSQFGSGWAWLVCESGALKIVKSSNAATPLTGKARPLLAIDVWEHAYYLDYENRRVDYVATVIDKLINWNFGAANFGK